ncbi:MAG: maleylpyruvate isomerase N-terminal domain-containing protein [Candidatus Buchananbacteria bacterium]|nr:maleylpyruvate isomerase N-terminal domain-containing protein [Candidatus Buchananbacteria bacterium]
MFNNINDQFIKLLESLDDSQWNLPVNKNWTIKGVVAHLVGWEKEAAEQLPIIWQTKSQPWFFQTDDYKKFNQQSIDRYSKLSGKELIKTWLDLQDKIEMEIQKIGEDNLRANPEFLWVFDEGENSHYSHHFNQIKKALTGV